MPQTQGCTRVSEITHFLSARSRQSVREDPAVFSRQPEGQQLLDFLRVDPTAMQHHFSQPANLQVCGQTDQLHHLA
jgi:hypothetical protein